MEQSEIENKVNNSNHRQFRGNKKQIELAEAKLEKMGVKLAKFLNKCIQDFVSGKLEYTPDELKRIK